MSVSTKSSGFKLVQAGIILDEVGEKKNLLRQIEFSRNYIERGKAFSICILELMHTLKWQNGRC
jgi:hypothetical protein